MKAVERNRRRGINTESDNNASSYRNFGTNQKTGHEITFHLDETVPYIAVEGDPLPGRRVLFISRILQLVPDNSPAIWEKLIFTQPKTF